MSRDRDAILSYLPEGWVDEDTFLTELSETLAIPLIRLGAVAAEREDGTPGYAGAVAPSYATTVEEARWAGQLIGARVPEGLSLEETIRQASRASGWSRGRPDAIVAAAAQDLLLGEPRLVERDTSAYHFLVRLYQGSLPGLRDSFTRPSGTALDADGTWWAQSAGQTIQGGRLVATALSHAAYRTPLPAGDQMAQAVVTIDKASTVKVVGVGLGFADDGTNDTDGYYGVIHWNGSAHLYVIYRRTGTGVTNIGSGNLGDLGDGPITVRLELDADASGQAKEQRLYVDGTLRRTLNDTAHPVGPYAGLWQNSATTLDDWEARAGADPVVSTTERIRSVTPAMLQFAVEVLLGPTWADMGEDFTSWADAGSYFASPDDTASYVPGTRS